MNNDFGGASSKSSVNLKHHWMSTFFIEYAIWQYWHQGKFQKVEATLSLTSVVKQKRAETS